MTSELSYRTEILKYDIYRDTLSEIEEISSYPEDADSRIKVHSLVFLFAFGCSLAALSLLVELIIGPRKQETIVLQEVSSINEADSSEFDFDQEWSIADQNEMKHHHI